MHKALSQKATLTGGFFVSGWWQARPDTAGLAFQDRLWDSGCCAPLMRSDPGEPVEGTDADGVLTITLCCKEVLDLDALVDDC